MIKNIFIVSILLVLLSCASFQKNYSTIPSVETSFSTLDSLDRINFYDYQGQTLREMLLNTVLNDYLKAHVVTGATGCLDRLDLIYDDRSRKFIRIDFPSLKYSESRCREYPDQWTLEMLLDEQILEMRFDEFCLPIVVNDSVQEEEFLREFKAIEFEKYYGRPIEELSDIPVLKTKSSISFLHENSCVNAVYFSYELLNRKKVSIVLYPQELKYTKKCIDLEEEYWNFNDFEKEILAKVKVVYR